MTKGNFNMTSEECPFYDEGDGGYGSHCNLLDSIKGVILTSCKSNNCPLNEWFSSPKFGIIQENNGCVRIVTADD